MGNLKGIEKRPEEYSKLLVYTLDFLNHRVPEEKRIHTLPSILQRPDRDGVSAAEFVPTLNVILVRDTKDPNPDETIAHEFYHYWQYTTNFPSGGLPEFVNADAVAVLPRLGERNVKYEYALSILKSAIVEAGASFFGHMFYTPDYGISTDSEVNPKHVVEGLSYIWHSGVDGNNKGLLHLVHNSIMNGEVSRMIANAEEMYFGDELGRITQAHNECCAISEEPHGKLSHLQNELLRQVQKRSTDELIWGIGDAIALLAFIDKGFDVGNTLSVLSSSPKQILECISSMDSATITRFMNSLENNDFSMERFLRNPTF